MRADKYLWCVRLFKTRTLAADALKGGRVHMQDAPVKPARELEINDVFTLRRPPVRYTYRVKGIPKSRVGAPLVTEYLEDLTPASELALLEAPRGALNIQRAPGTGRPTKKERRALDALRNELYNDDDE